MIEKTSQYKKYLWVFVFGFAWGVFWWLSGLQIFDAINLLEKDGTVWLVPNICLLLLKLTIAEIAVFVLIFYPVFLKKVSVKTIDIKPYFPSLILLIVLFQFIPQTNKISEFPRFLIYSLGPALPVTTVLVILYLRFKDTIAKIYAQAIYLIEKQSIVRLSAVLFTGTLIMYVLFSLLLVHPNTAKEKRYYLLTGDEPQYLLLTHSLVFDRDFNLYNNVENGNSLRYFDRIVNGFSGGLELFGHHAKGRGSTAHKEYWVNKRYSLFRLGLPMLLSPFYSLGVLWDNQVRLCIILFINILASFFIINIFLLSRDIAQNKFSSFLITLFVSLSMPIVFYSRQIYSDLPSALLLVYSFRKIYEQDFNSILKIFFLSICISYMPWMHEKNILLVLFLVVYFICQFKKSKYDGKYLLVFSVPFLISLFLQMRYYFLLFGVPYPVNMHPGFFISNIFKGGLGLFLDEAHGLIPYAPLYAISIVGIVLFLKNRKNTFWILMFPVSFFLATACFKEWWGGFCPAGRYLLPVVPFLAVLAAYAYLKIESAFFKVIVLVLGLIGIVVGIGGMIVPGRLYRHMHPFISYSENFHLKGIFPNFSLGDSGQYILALVWMCFILACVVIYAYRKYTKFWILSLCMVFLFVLNLVRIEEPKQFDRYTKMQIYKSILENKIHVVFKGKDGSCGLINDKQSIVSNLVFCYEAEELLSEKKNKVRDDSASSGAVVAGIKGSTETGYMLYGPYAAFPKGRYSITFSIKTDDISVLQGVAVLDCASDRGKEVHAKKEIIGTDFKDRQVFQDFTFFIELTHEVKDLELRVDYTGRVNIWVDKTTIKPVLINEKI